MYILTFPKSQESAVKQFLIGHNLLESTNNESESDSDQVRYELNTKVDDSVLDKLKNLKDVDIVDGKGGGKEAARNGSNVHPDQSGKNLPPEAMGSQGNPTTSATSAPGTVPATEQVTTTADTGETSGIP